MNNALEKPGNRLKKWIDKEYGGNQKKCAEELGIRPSTLSALVRSKSSPYPDTIERIGRAGLNIDYWLFGRGEMIASDDREQVEGMPEIIPASVLLQIPHFDLSTPEGQAAYMEYYAKSMARQIAEELDRIQKQDR